MSRDRMSFHSNKVVERIYRPRSRHSRSPRLRDKFLEHRHSGHGHDFRYHSHPRYSSSREWKSIDRLRRSQPVGSNYSRGRMHSSHSALKLRHRTIYSPARMRRRHHIHSRDRSKQLIDHSRSSRLASTERESKIGTVELCHSDANLNPKETADMNANNVKPTSDADLGKSNRGKREQKGTMGRTTK